MVSVILVPREIICYDDHTSDKDRNVDRCALHAHIATAKYGTEKASVGGIASLSNFVTTVELGVATGLNRLLDSVVSLDSPLIGGAVTGVLAFVANILVTFSVIARRGDLAGDEGRSRDGEGKSQEREDVLGKHGDW